MSDQRENISNLISAGDLEDAIRELRKLFLEEGLVVGNNQLLVVSSNLEALKRKINQGIIDNEDAGVERAKITKALVDLLYESSKEELKDDLTGSDILQYKSYIERIIGIQKSSIRRFNILSLGLAAIAIVFICWAYFWGSDGAMGIDSASDYVQMGFGIFSMLLPLWLQGMNQRRRERIVNLNALLEFIMNSKNLSQDLKSKIENKIIENISGSLTFQS